MKEITMMFWGIMLPFIGTSLGAASVFCVKNVLDAAFQKIMLGFASGVMMAACVWSLLLPALNMASGNGLVPTAGFMSGIAFLAVLDILIPKIEIIGRKPGKSAMMIFAVTLHNIPEGMAVGIVFAGLRANAPDITAAGAFALSFGIAVQNLPEGAIISMPLACGRFKKKTAFLCGVLSGVVEPVGAVITLLITSLIVPFMPFILSFAAGAMIFVVVDELIPEAQSGSRKKISTVSTGIGFALMMLMDVAFG